MRKANPARSPDDQASAALRGGFLLIILFYVFEYLRLQDSFLPFLAPLKLPMLITLALMIFILRSNRDKLKDPQIIAIFFLLAQVVIWVPFARNNFYAFQTAQNMVLTIVSVLATVLALSSYARLRTFFAIFSAIIVVLALWVMTHGGKGPGGFLLDENDAALVLVTGLPFVAYWSLCASKRKFRVLAVIGTLLVISGVVASSSRGGFVGLVAVVLLLIWYSKKRWKNLFTLVLLGSLMGGVVISLLPEGYVEDMQTIDNTNEGTANLRFLHWTTAFEIYKDNPVFGVGPANYPWTSNEYFHLSPYFKEGARFRSGRQAHSLYFTLIPELGSLGIAIFGFLLINFSSRTGKLMKRLGGKASGTEDEDKRLFLLSFSKALRVGMAGFLVSALFISVLYYPIFWHLLGIFLALEIVAKIGEQHGT